MAERPALRTMWEIVPLTKRNWSWRVERGNQTATGTASSETTAYMAADAALDEFLFGREKGET